MRNGYPRVFHRTTIYRFWRCCAVAWPPTEVAIVARELMHRVDLDYAEIGAHIMTITDALPAPIDGGGCGLNFAAYGWPRSTIPRHRGTPNSHSPRSRHPTAALRVVASAVLDGSSTAARAPLVSCGRRSRATNGRRHCASARHRRRHRLMSTSGTTDLKAISPQPR